MGTEPWASIQLRRRRPNAVDGFGDLFAIPVLLCRAGGPSKLRLGGDFTGGVNGLPREHGGESGILLPPLTYWW
jgi:hypothetical protein